METKRTLFVKASPIAVPIMRLSSASNVANLLRSSKAIDAGKLKKWILFHDVHDSLNYRHSMACVFSQPTMNRGKGREAYILYHFAFTR